MKLASRSAVQQIVRRIYANKSECNQCVWPLSSEKMSGGRTAATVWRLSNARFRLHTVFVCYSGRCVKLGDNRVINP